MKQPTISAIGAGKPEEREREREREWRDAACN
jgi:hypothetical protein